MKRLFNLHNLFLFAVVVVLPVCVAYYSINNMIEEQYLASKENITNELRRQIANLEHTSIPEYQIKDFLEILIKDKKICRQKPEIIKKFIDDANKSYPEAFKWYFLDENYNTLQINSRHTLGFSKYWQKCLKGGIYVWNRLKDGKKDTNYDKVFEEYISVVPFMQSLMGDENKVEHIFEQKNKTIKAKWLQKDCYVIWDIDGISFNQFGRVKEIAGVCALVVFPEKLPEDIWYKRQVLRRQKTKEKYKFPIAVINITKNNSLILDKTLPNSKNFVDDLVKAYNQRAKEIFEYKNYLVGTTEYDKDSELRMLSLADMSSIKIKKGYMQLLLIISCILLIIISTSIAIYIKNIHIAIVSLRQRIAAIFIIAMTLPLLSLISVGITFLSNEENRLKESAYIKMRTNIETLNLHYKDTPRLIEVDLYERIKKLLGTPPYDIKDITNRMNKASEDGIINQFIFFKDDKIISSNWKNQEPGFEKAISFLAKKVMEKGELETKAVPNNKKILEDLVEDEFRIMEKLLNNSFDLSRPSHLRYLGILDQHFYTMSIRIIVEDKPALLLIFLLDNIIEENFTLHEFSKNFYAKPESNKNPSITELSFYSTLDNKKHYPEGSPIFKELENVLKLSSKLNIEESGIVNIEDENFLYLTKPINSMNTKTYQPCMLTSTRPIESRIRDVKILLIALSSLAIVGSILLSFILSSSLLVPIKKIDSAAQKIGKGNLNINLPVEGNDELSRLSITFNEMVKGLRESERMRAYVSDSVLEAVKDNSDQSIHVGKYVEATILFSDIRNFTGLSEANAPDVVFKSLNDFFSGAEPIIRMNHGRVDKYIGDAVMAIFHQNIPEHHALSAIKAAVRIKNFVTFMNKDRLAKGLFPIEIGVGISTGYVLLGDVGSHRRKDLTVIGDEVNLASRLESASKQGKYSKIIFSGQTLKFVEEYVEAVKMPFEDIRGKKKAVQIYEFIKFKNMNKQSYLE